MSVVSQASTMEVAVDHSSGSLTALALATDDTLILCTVLEGDSGDEVVHQARQQLANLAPEAETQVRVGSPFIELIRAAREADARLIVAGATGEHTKGQLALGVTVDRLARKADRPLLVVREASPGWIPNSNRRSRRILRRCPSRPPRPATSAGGADHSHHGNPAHRGTSADHEGHR